MTEFQFLLEKFRREVNEFLSEAPTQEDDGKEYTMKLLKCAVKFFGMSFTADELQREMLKQLQEMKENREV